MNILSDSDIPGWVYLVWAVGTPRYKIGKSCNPERRLDELNQQSCYPLKLLDNHWFENVGLHERRIHQLLREYRVHGEWFELPSWVVEYTDVWLHDPACAKLKKGKTGKIIVHNGACNPLVFSRRSHIAMHASRPFKTPPTQAGIERAVALLGNVAKGVKLSTRNQKQLQQLIGVTPTAKEAIEWKRALKEII